MEKVNIIIKNNILLVNEADLTTQTVMEPLSTGLGGSGEAG